MLIAYFLVMTLRHLEPSKAVYTICVWKGKLVTFVISISSISSRTSSGFSPYSNVKILSTVTLPN